MIAACPLSYVLTAIVLAAQTMSGLERRAFARLLERAHVER